MAEPTPRPMSAWEHYREAERLLALAAVQENWQAGRFLAASAQAHATLAAAPSPPPRDYATSPSGSDGTPEAGT